jgi:carbonic anhydrase/acetyltransferase-like protein (isoleucine patch superfamily)
MFIDRVGRAWRRWQLEWRGAHIANDLQSSSLWIGANVVVLKGVKIGDGAVVGAGSVVTSDVSPQCIFTGNPAAFLKTRR